MRRFLNVEILCIIEELVEVISKIGIFVPLFMSFF